MACQYVVSQRYGFSTVQMTWDPCNSRMTSLMKAYVDWQHEAEVSAARVR